MTLERIETDDGSITYYNTCYKDIYHSTSGAKEESIEKFAKQSMNDYFLDQESLVLFDICFGMGYNSAAFLDVLEKNIKNDMELTIVAFENDVEILNNSKEQEDNLFANYKIIKDCIKESIETNEFVDKEFELSGKKVSLTFILALGDAKTKIKELDIKGNITFFDAFGPNKHPEMWEEQFFLDIEEKMSEYSLFITYSCARHVRDKLTASGLIVKDGAKVGRRAPSTLAYSKKLIDICGIK